MVNLERMRALEANSEWQGVSRRLLMENAGGNLVREICDRKSPENEVLIFAGKGNNGGDGSVAARHLINRGFIVRHVLLGRPGNITTNSAEENWYILSQMEEDIDLRIIRDSSEIDKLDIEADIVVDAMLGTGIRGGLREPVASAVDLFNELDAYKIAVDVPTGVDPESGEVLDDSTRCDLTVTFHEIKPGLEKAEDEYTGEVVSADIGIPISAERKAGPGDVEMAIHPRKIGSHKGQNGRLLIVGGSSQYVGAPALAGLAALKSGIDLVTIALPSEKANIVNSFSPDLITYELPGKELEPKALSGVENVLEESTGVIIGPGLGLESSTREAVVELMNILVEKWGDMPVLLDADGLKILSEEPQLLSEAQCVLTPHAGEFELLTGSSLPEDEEERIERVSEASKELNSSILLKSHTDICADSDGEVILNDTGNPGMTVGGTGDVLSGIVGTFLSQGSDPLRSAAAGSFICGLAGDFCREELGYEFTASDVKDRIPIAISKAREYW